MPIHARLPAISSLVAIALLASTSIASWAGQGLTMADYQRLKADDRGTMHGSTAGSDAPMPGMGECDEIDDLGTDDG